MTEDERAAHLKWWLDSMRRLQANAQRDRRIALAIDAFTMSCLLVTLGLSIAGALQATIAWHRWLNVGVAVLNAGVFACIARQLRVTWIRLKLMEAGMRRDIDLALGLAALDKESRDVHGDAPLGGRSDT